MAITCSDISGVSLELGFPLAIPTLKPSSRLETKGGKIMMSMGKIAFQ
jgi:hypothetical protein